MLWLQQQLVAWLLVGITKNTYYSVVYVCVFWYCSLRSFNLMLFAGRCYSIRCNDKPWIVFNIVTMYSYWIYLQTNIWKDKLSIGSRLVSFSIVSKSHMITLPQNICNNTLIVINSIYTVIEYHFPQISMQNSLQCASKSILKSILNFAYVCGKTHS